MDKTFDTSEVKSVMELAMRMAEIVRSCRDPKWDSHAQYCKCTWHRRETKKRDDIKKLLEKVNNTDKRSSG